MRRVSTRLPYGRRLGTYHTAVQLTGEHTASVPGVVDEEWMGRLTRKPPWY